uniref:Si:ch211-194b1.1 n=1 Tax=Sinocyclocheilus grahami TaxID=75366 RepID=A0A672QSP1_SINGR
MHKVGPESPFLCFPGSNLLKCEFCGAAFETRRGLSSHARSHLRQLGIGMSENSGAPIDLLYQITKERSIDAHFTKGLLDTKPLVPFSIAGSAIKVSSSPTTHSAAGSLPSSPFVKSRSPSPVLRKAPISSLLPVSSPLRSQEHKTLGKNQSTNLSSPNKPFWAPQESDAPLNLTMDMDSKDIICKLCGAWFETRKGLSSHARAHLRHFGIEYSESKGSPIDLLNRFILTDDFKHRANSFLSNGPEDLRSRKTSLLPSTSTSPKRSLHSSPVLYKTATSSLRTTIGSKATSSSTHPLLGPPPKKLKPSSLQVLRFSSGEVMSFPIGNNFYVLINCSLPEPMKDVGCEFCGELFENRKGLSSHARSHLRQLGITEWSVNGSPIDTLKEIIVRRGLPSIIPLKSPKSPSSSPSSGLPRTAVQSSSPPGNVVALSSTSPVGKIFGVPPLKKKVLVEEGQPGERALLIQSKNFSLKNNVTSSFCFSFSDASCELCGFYFENRKALASHARAHLRQFGVTEWCVNGSPIETLSAWIRSRPQKAAEMQQSYAQGARYAQKKQLDGMSTVAPGGCHHGELTQKAGVEVPLSMALFHRFERRPLKHPSHAEGGEGESGPPKPRSSTVPALVPKPPSTPLVRLVGKIYSLKCRFCDVEFHGPLSVQEDWIRHLQQHILNLNYNKTASPRFFEKSQLATHLC